jgi:hypothetical protein
MERTVRKDHDGQVKGRIDPYPEVCMVRLLARALREEGRAVDVAADGPEGLWLGCCVTAEAGRR